MQGREDNVIDMATRRSFPLDPMLAKCSLSLLAVSRTARRTRRMARELAKHERQEELRRLDIQRRIDALGQRMAQIAVESH